MCFMAQSAVEYSTDLSGSAIRSHGLANDLLNDAPWNCLVLRTAHPGPIHNYLSSIGPCSMRNVAVGRPSPCVDDARSQT